MGIPSESVMPLPSQEQGQTGHTTPRPPPFAERPKIMLFYSASAAAMSQLLNGYDDAAFGFVVLYLAVDASLNFTALQIGILIGMYNMVSGLGCWISGPLYDAFGRKNVMIAGNVTAALGNLVVAFATNFGAFFFGRFIMGIGSGLATTGPIMYCAEISPPQIRGLVGGFSELFINFGILFGYLSGYMFPSNWRPIIAAGTALPLAAAAMELFMIESPRWLVDQGREKEARVEMRKVIDCSQEREDENVASIVGGLNDEKNVQTSSSKRWEEILYPSRPLQLAMVAGWGVSFFQQAIGSEAIVYFTPTVLQQGGVPPGSNLLVTLSALVGVSRASFTVASMMMIDNIGRRPLLLTSISGVVASVFAIVVAYATPDPVLWLGSMALVTYVIFFSVGYGPLAGVLCGELFPLHIRGTTNGIGWGINRVTSGLVTFIFLPVDSAIGVSGTFGVFLCVSLLALAHAVFLVPETKGMSLEEIGRMLEGKSQPPPDHEEALLKSSG